MNEYYNEYFSEPYDPIIDEAKQKIEFILKQDIKEKIEQAKTLNKELIRINRELRERKFELDNLENKLKEMNRKIQNMENEEIPKAYIRKMVSAVTKDLNIGDTVWVVEFEYIDTKETCGICDGIGKIKYKSRELKCPNCSGSGKTKPQIRYVVKRRKVEEIVLKLCFDEDNVHYWNRDTIYLDGNDIIRNVNDMYLTEEEAIRVANNKNGISEKED